MKRPGIRKQLGTMLMGVVLSVELAVLADAMLVFFDLRMTPVVFALVLCGLFLCVQLCRPLTLRRKAMICGAIPAAAAVFCLVCFGIWHSFRTDAGYADVDAGKEALYADRSVMVIVPHEDDEINILGGVTEELLRYGSTVRIVYVTNGDQKGLGEARMEEALSYCAALGIPEENVIFLGYGDCWSPEIGVHIYNAAPGQALTSWIGRTETYGLDTHPAWRDGAAYTIDNLLQDLEDVILAFQPDVLFCTDYDEHIDHKSTTLAFEKVMGKLLRENPGYQPLVFKGYAYGTAWFSEADYYDSLNVLSTRNLFAEPYNQKPVVYHWDEALRLPVAGRTLSRSLVNSDAYRGLKQYASQYAQTMAVSVVNGDRVFWQRRTDSLCTDAAFEVSSGDGELLHNFMLIDNFDIWEQENPYNGVWQPDAADTKKSVEVTFPEPAYLSSIVLYDHPDAAQNVLNAVVTFDDGTVLETGPLCTSGAATRIPVEKADVRQFTVALVQTEGDAPGLSEIEAFSQPVQGDLSYVKLTDGEGNFLYDYQLESEEPAALGLYVYGESLSRDLTGYTVTCDNDALQLTRTESGLTVACPVGESGIITLREENLGVSDSIYIHNPGKGSAWYARLGQTIENYGAFQFRQSIAFRVGKRILGIIGV